MSDNTQSMGAPKPRSRGAWLSFGVLIAAVALAIGVNVLADRFLARARIDLTDQRLYTLSEGTRREVASLR
ncbi:MAG TPA: ABC transporter, partial [Roseomonas sp.]